MSSKCTASSRRDALYHPCRHRCTDGKTLSATSDRVPTIGGSVRLLIVAERYNHHMTGSVANGGVASTPLTSGSASTTTSRP